MRNLLSTYNKLTHRTTCPPDLINPQELYQKKMSDTQEEMKIDPSRAQALILQLGSVKERLAAVANGRNVCTSLAHPYHRHHPSSSLPRWP